MLDGAGTVIPLSGGQDFVAKSTSNVFQISFFPENMDSNTSVKKVNLENMRNGFGCEISASGQRYHSAGTIEHSNWLG